MPCQDSKALPAKILTTYLSKRRSTMMKSNAKPARFAYRVAAVQALASIFIVGLIGWSSHSMAQSNPATSRDHQQVSGQAGGATEPQSSRNPQADQWVTETPMGPDHAQALNALHSQPKPHNCECGEDCQCLDPLICKHKACKTNYAVFFTARWCAACRVMYPMVNSMREKGYTIFVLDVDDYPEAARLANAHTLPTTIIFEGGKEIKRHIGVTRQVVLEETLKKKDATPAPPSPPAPPQPPPPGTPSTDPDYYLI
jgi:thiol-disulfide isomerase/thioredoxin